MVSVPRERSGLQHLAGPRALRKPEKIAWQVRPERKAGYHIRSTVRKQKCAQPGSQQAPNPTTPSATRHRPCHERTQSARRHALCRGSASSCPIRAAAQRTYAPACRTARHRPKHDGSHEVWQRLQKPQQASAGSPGRSCLSFGSLGGQFGRPSTRSAKASTDTQARGCPLLQRSPAGRRPGRAHCSRKRPSHARPLERAKAS
jgi:hypothetical protein